MAPPEGSNSRLSVHAPALQLGTVPVKAEDVQVKKEDIDHIAKNSKMKVKKLVKKSQEQDQTIKRLNDRLASEQRKTDELRGSSEKLQARIDSLEKQLRDTVAAHEGVEREYDSFRAWVMGQATLIREKTREHRKHPFPEA